MKLYEFKRKHMSKLALYEPTSKREKELRDILITKLSYLRAMDTPNFVHTLYLIIEHENVSSDFKKLCREILEDVSKLELASD